MRSPTSSNKPRADSQTVQPRQWEFEAIGTHWTIGIYQDIPDTTIEQLQAAVKNRIDSFDAVYSRFRNDSLISQMSRSAGSYTLPDDARPMMDAYHRLYILTDGAMTPLVGDLLSDAGYDATYSLQPKSLRPVPAWNDVIDYDFPSLILRQPALLDLGALGKGYLIDLVSGLLEATGIRHYCVDAGGDLRQRGLAIEDDRIGLEHPNLHGQVVGVASIGDRSLCGSAGNRRAWGDTLSTGKRQFHHIMDPHRLAPVRDVAALWVTAEDTLTADALTTALCFGPPDKLLAEYTFEYAILYDRPAGLELVRSTGFPAEFFIS